MANTATSIYIDTSGTGPKQTGHPEFELSEAIGFSPFTIELWYRHDNVSEAMGSPADWCTFMSITNTTAGPDNTTVSTAGSDFYLMGQYGAGQNYYSSDIYDTDGTSGGTINSNDYNAGEIIRNTSWHHFAVTREFGEFAGIWHDGLLIGGNNNAYADRTIAGKRVELGFNRFDAGDYPFKGYMDEVRISKKVRYGNFDAPTAPLSTSQSAGRGKNAISPHHVKILVQANSSTTTSDIPGDLSGNFAADASNRATFSQTQTQFGNCAIYFDGTTGLNFPVASTSDLDWSGDWSYEAWVYTTNTSSYTWWWGQSAGGTGPNNAWFFQLNPAAQNGGIYSSGTGANEQYSETLYHTTHNTNQWQHWAMGIVNDSWYIFKDGQMYLERPTSSLYRPANSTRPFWIGRREAGGNVFSGYMDNIRICCGQSAYTPNFTPYGGQKNVVHNRGGAITDARLASANTHAIQMGRAAIGSDAATNANTYCLDFDGSADYLLHKVPAWNSTDSQGTIVAWIYNDDVSGDEVIFSSSDTAGATTYLQLLMSGANIEVNQKSGDTEDSITGGTTLSASTWYMVAVTSTGSAYALYVNGAAESLTVNTGSNGGDWLSDTSSAARDNIAIGVRKDDTPDLFFNGKIMQVAYFGGIGGSQGVLTAAQLLALHNAGKGHDFTTATGVYTASEIDDLKGYWRMGNHYLDTAQTIYDASGNGYDMHEVSDPAALTYTTGTTFLNNWQHRGYFTPDKYTSLLLQSSTNEGATSFQDTGSGFKKMSFDASGDYLRSLASYRGSDKSGSVSIWLKRANAQVGTWWNVGNDSPATNYFYLYTKSDNTIQMDFNDSSNRTILYSTDTVGSGAWQNIIVTQTGDPDDSEPLKIYINGTKSSQTEHASLNNVAKHLMWFGNVTNDRFLIGGFDDDGTPTDLAKGLISQVAVWGGTTANATGAVLSASDVSAIYALGPNGNVKTDYDTGLVDYWTMGNLTGEGDDMVTSGTTVYSQVTGGVDLTTAGVSAPFAGHTLTRHAQAEHKTDKSVFGGSSIYFPASPAAKCLTVADSIDWALGAHDWTLELWVNPYDISGNECYLGHGTSSGPHTRWYFIQEDGGQLYFDYYTSGTNTVRIQSDAVLKAQTWQHVALIHDSTGGPNGNEDYLLYHDGILVKTLDQSNDVGATTGDLHIGTNTASSGAEDPYKGHMDEIRISSGVARYSKSIERFANTFVAKGDTGDAYTSLQIQSNGAKNGTGYSDDLNRTGFSTSAVTVTGTPEWRNTVGDGFGGANTALYFDGNSELVYADSTDFEFPASTDFTIELWFNVEKYNSAIGGYLFSKWWYTGGGTRREYSAGIRGTGQSLDFNADEGGDRLRIIQHISLSTWYHYVVQRKDGVIQAYLNGVLGDSAVLDTEFGGGTGSPAADLAIGASLGAGATYRLIGYLDQFRLSKGIARYGKYQLRTTQQIHVSANADSGVITSNSTFGSANNIFETDGHTVMLLNGDELYANTLVASGAHTFHRNVGGNNVSNVTTTFATSVQASVEQVGGGTGNVYTINGALRPTDLVLVRDNHYNFQIANSNYTSHPLKFSTTSGGTHSPGGTEYTTGITVVQEAGNANTVVKFSPTSATPDTLYYYCSSHNLMGGQIAVTDSTGSDGKIATQPFAMFKGDGTAAAGGPTQRHGFSAYGANSYYYDGTDLVRTAKAMVGGGTTINDNFDFGKEDFTIEYWESPNAAGPDHVWCLAGGGPAAQRVFEAYYYANGAFNLVYGLGGTSSPNFDSYYNRVNEWVHVAIQGRWIGGAGNIEIWRNGNLHTVSGNSFTTALSSLSTISSGSPGLYIGGLYGGTGSYEGFFDSWRISKGIARYGYSGTNAKLGTNTVHHSNAKLLITSNTFNGNTHFDDFSDQGNYWNQQPLSYYFDGSDDYVDVGSSAPVSDYPFTFSFWFNPRAVDGAYLGGMFDEGSATIGFSVRTGSSGEAVLRRRNSTDATATTATNSLILDNWHHVLAVYTNDTSSAIYVDGEISATSTTDVDFNTAVDNLVWGGERDSSPGSYLHGRLSSAAMWSVALTQANARSMWALGPAGNLLTDFSDNILVYHAMGNHNDLGGRPADTSSTVYDRSGNGRDGVTAGTMNAPAKGIGGAITNQGTVKHSTDIKNFGSSALRFPGANPDYLTMPDKILPYFHDSDWTIEAWIWFEKSSTGTLISKTASSTYGQIRIDIATSGLITTYFTYDGTTGAHVTMNNDGNRITLKNWHHLAVQRRNRINDASSSKIDSAEMYIDGILSGEKELSGALWDNTDQWEIGRLDGTNHYVYEGYVDELGIIVGAAKYNPVVTGLGTATITPSYLDDPTGNHFTPSGLAITDQMLDSPENNFCTWNAIHPTVSRSSPAMMAGEGNLQVQGTGAQWNPVFGSMGFTSGKWYYEVKYVTLGTTEPRVQVGWAAHDKMSVTAYADGDNDQTGDPVGTLTDYAVMHSWGDQGYSAGGGATTGYATISTDGLSSVPIVNDVAMLAMDLDNNKFSFGLNGIWYGNINPANGDSNFSSTNVSGSGTATGMRDSSVVGPYTPFAFLRDAGSGTDATPKIIANFGQGDPDGENNYADSNGRGGFRYEPPQGFGSLCTTNMKDADYAPLGPNSAASTPDKHFDTLLYTDTYISGKPNRVGGLNFKPDLVWIKCREGAEGHSLNDTVRGAHRRLFSNAVNAEDAGGIAEFTEDGFVGSAGYGSDGDSTGHDFVAWCWKAGNGTTINNDGTIQSTTSVNSDAGFSIVSYTGNATTGATFGHGLSQRPDFVAIKQRTDGSNSNWLVWHQSLTAHNYYVHWDTNGAQATNSAFFTNFGASTITLGNANHTNGNGDQLIAYCWHEVEGYSKFGKYDANTNADGPFVYLGFRPAFVMLKTFSGTSNSGYWAWTIYDNKRVTTNPNHSPLYANHTVAEGFRGDGTTSSGGDGLYVDFLSNGFKLRNNGTEGNPNVAGDDLLYVAFAEMPFKYANAR